MPRNCAGSTVKDVGLVAVEGGRGQIYVGGAAGATIRQGDILATVDSHEEAMRRSTGTPTRGRPTSRSARRGSSTTRCR